MSRENDGFFRKFALHPKNDAQNSSFRRTTIAFFMEDMGVYTQKMAGNTKIEDVLWVNCHRFYSDEL